MTKRVRLVIRITRASEVTYEKVGENSLKSVTERLMKTTMQNSRKNS